MRFCGVFYTDSSRSIALSHVITFGTTIVKPWPQAWFPCLISWARAQHCKLAYTACIHCVCPKRTDFDPSRGRATHYAQPQSNFDQEACVIIIITTAAVSLYFIQAKLFACLASTARASTVAMQLYTVVII